MILLCCVIFWGVNFFLMMSHQKRSPLSRFVCLYGLYVYRDTRNANNIEKLSQNYRGWHKHQKKKNTIYRKSENCHLIPFNFFFHIGYRENECGLFLATCLIYFGWQFVQVTNFLSYKYVFSLFWYTAAFNNGSVIRGTFHWL